jgi:hypothetical protein
MRVTPLALLALAGCVTTNEFDRSALRAKMGDETAQVTEKQVQEVMALRPQLSFPCNIAVYFHPDGGWTGKERALVDSWCQALKQQGIVASMFVMSDLFVDGQSLTALRVTAARHGADALLVLKGASQITSYVNPAALFNLTVVGGYVIPASHRDALFLVQGGLLDVGNGFIYASVESEAEAGIIRPTFVIDEKVAVERARKQALVNFGPALVRRMQGLRSMPMRAPTVLPARLSASPARLEAPVTSAATLQPPQPLATSELPPVVAPGAIRPVPGSH